MSASVYAVDEAAIATHMHSVLAAVREHTTAGPEWRSAAPTTPAELAQLHPSFADFADIPVDSAAAVPSHAPYFPRCDTRWLGDHYQSSSDAARLGRALCQTPDYVAELILDCTLDRAIGRGYDYDGRNSDPDVIVEPADLRLIDPSCGTGHFLLDAARRVYHRMPGSSADRVRLTAAAVRGVDLDPYAALVARLRLVLFLSVVARVPLAKLPDDLPISVAAADSLLDKHPLLTPRQYHVVVGNPPYITAKDPVQNAAIRERWGRVCYRQFSLAVPFELLMHDLAVPGGWVGRITTNAFMKREYGKRLIEEFFPTVDLRWVIDTSGAYIPGHGTPTVILISRNQPPVGEKVPAILGGKGEPRRPDDPAQGLVWCEIAEKVRERESLDRLTRALPAPANITHSTETAA